MDSLIDGIMSLGFGCLMAKFDMASANRKVAIHSDDRYFFDMSWWATFLWVWHLIYLCYDGSLTRVDHEIYLWCRDVDKVLTDRNELLTGRFIRIHYYEFLRP